ncbi:LAME_0B02608g1_1 [Lachancea meyersii CBS 8951]|uniref:LAME_0B02608g1_1 n=1 Tax=Lachancea meyersii CBS 8951 TaxID=1266667 RepID=A0A1G4IU32_9SACH|nr:LAME_0B02608g1_1 [Lachancea meyersii CBS 8951]
MNDVALTNKFLNEILVSYCVSPGEQFLLCLYVTIDKPSKAFIRVRNLKSDQKIKKYEVPIELSSLAFHRDSFGLQLVQVSKAVGGKKIEFEHYIIVNTGDVLHFFTLEQLFSIGEYVPYKWRHNSSTDTVTSFHAYNVRGPDLQVVYCTKFGAIVKFDFDSNASSFKLVSEFKDAASDCISHCEPCTSTHKNKDAIEIPELVFSSFDNCIYSLEGTLQKFPAVDTLSEQKILVSAVGVVAKQYSKKSLRYYVANVLNGGCHLFKRSANDTWDETRILERDTVLVEKSPLVNCCLTCQSRTQLQIVSGSESGKIYYWCYDYRDDNILESHVLQVAETQDIVYNLQVVGPSIYYMVNRDIVGSAIIP